MNEEFRKTWLSWTPKQRTDYEFARNAIIFFGHANTPEISTELLKFMTLDENQELVGIVKKELKIRDEFDLL